MKKIACFVFEVNDDQELKSVVDKVEQICQTKKVEVRSIESVTEDWRTKLKTILFKLGINPSIMGYEAVFAMLEAVEKNPSLKNLATMKELFAYATQKTGVTYQKLERRIRSIVDIMFAKNSKEHINEVLQIELDIRNSMKAADFIGTLIGVVFN